MYFDVLAILNDLYMTQKLRNPPSYTFLTSGYGLSFTATCTVAHIKHGLFVCSGVPCARKRDAKRAAAELVVDALNKQIQPATGNETAGDEQPYMITLVSVLFVINNL